MISRAQLEDILCAIVVIGWCAVCGLILVIAVHMVWVGL